MICTALTIQRIYPPDETRTHYTAVSHAEILQIAGLTDLQHKIDSRTLQYAGHVARMGPERDPTRLLFNTAAPTGLRSYTQTVSRAALRAGIQGTWPTAAQNRDYWAETVHRYMSPQ